jgi:FtsH-binding integral membrane protein
MQNPFNQNVANQNQYNLPYAGGYSAAVRSSVLAKVSGLLAFSMVFTALGAVVGMQAPGLGLPALIGVLILSFVVQLARNVPVLNLFLLYTLTTLMGVGLGGIIDLYVNAGAGTIVVEAAGSTALLTVGLAAYALTTKSDMSGWGSKLFIALIGLIAASVVGIFVQATILDIVIGLGGSVLFSLYLVYQINRARTIEDTLGNAIVVAVGIYLSIINLFLSLLRLLTALQGGSRR